MLIRADRTNCKIETFDCTVDGIIPSRISDRTRFHKVCLGAKSQAFDVGKKMVTWDELNALVGNPHGPDYLKIDIEGWELEAIPAIINHPNAPIQIAMELHAVVVTYEGGNRTVTRKAPRDMLRFYQQMYHAGYFVMEVKLNKAFKRASELLFVRMNCQGDRLRSPPYTKEDLSKRITDLRLKYRDDLNTNH